MPAGIFVLVILLFRIPKVMAFTDSLLEKIISRFVDDKTYNPLVVIDYLGGKTLANIKTALPYWVIITYYVMSSRPGSFSDTSKLINKPVRNLISERAFFY